MDVTIDRAPLDTARAPANRASNLDQPLAAGSTRGMSAELRALEQTILARNPSLISVDLFDTILLRGSEPQRVRWLCAARRAEAGLNRHGRRISAHALLHARAAATRAAMSMTQVLNGPEDIALETIFGQAVRLLGLPREAVRTLIDAELAEERARLRPNTPLLDLLSRHRAGRRLVVTSDTNLSAPMLAGLLDHFDASPRFDTIRTSADLGLTKQRGSIFPAIVVLEGVSETRILHIGDDPTADVEMPSRHGIAPFHLKRRGAAQFVRRARKFLVKVVHGER